MNPRYKRNINKEKRSMFNNIKESKASIYRCFPHIMIYYLKYQKKKFISLLNKIKNN